MKSPEAVRERLATTWRRNWTSWLGGGGHWPITVPLDPPTEAEARRHWSHFQAWVRTWSATEWDGIAAFASRSWPSLGSQELPTHVALPGPEAVAAFLGISTAREWTACATRWSERATAWPDLQEPLRGMAGLLGALDDADYVRFVDAFEWLAAHPDSDLYVRQLPISGLDSKWVETHAGLLSKLLAVRLGRPPGTLAQVAGLAAEPSRRRLRLLDPHLRSHFGGLSDLQVRLDELAELALPVRTVLVVENQQTALACDDLPGTVLLMGGGFSATELGELPWLARVPLVYWGDIDTAGFAILSALRASHPHTVSCLMDEDTLQSHRALWSHEDRPTLGNLLHLTPAEAALLAKLFGGHYGSGVRLEQERLAWSFAWPTLAAAVRASQA